MTFDDSRAVQRENVALYQENRRLRRALIWYSKSIWGVHVPKYVLDIMQRDAVTPQTAEADRGR